MPKTKKTKIKASIKPKTKKDKDVDEKKLAKGKKQDGKVEKKEGEQEEIIDPTVYFNPDELDIDLDVNEDPWGGLGVGAASDDDDSY